MCKTLAPFTEWTMTPLIQKIQHLNLFSTFNTNYIWIQQSFQSSTQHRNKTYCCQSKPNSMVHFDICVQFGASKSGCKSAIMNSLCGSKKKTQAWNQSSNCWGIWKKALHHSTFLECTHIEFPYQQQKKKLQTYCCYISIWSWPFKAN